jgi:leucyl aminopeptidase
MRMRGASQASYTSAMRTALVVGVLVCASQVASADQRFISIGSDAVPMAYALAQDDHVSMQVLDANDTAAVVAIDDRELDRLSEQMHEQFHRCGGFMVHDSRAEARDAIATHLVDKGPVDYTIDHPETVAAVLPELDRGRILSMIGELQAMKNRYYRSTTGAAASVWLRDRWRSLTDRADVTVTLFDQGYPQKSVILTIPGTTRANEVVVIGGHLDSIARGGVDADAPGADDDASGIATLTEVLRVLLAKDFRPARTLVFMAYAAEEIGLRGSQAIAKDYTKRGINVIGALQLDMTNYQGSDKDIWLMKDFTDAKQNAFVTALIDRYVGATWGLDACGYACSDHASWYRAGVPASMPFESRMKQYNRSIHTNADTLERSNNNADHAIKFARLGAAYAIELAKGDVPRAPVPADDSSKWKLSALALLALAGLISRRMV